MYAIPSTSTIALPGFQAWQPPRCDEVMLFHGCTETDVKSIFKNGIDPAVGRANTDFGRGFYTTPVCKQAAYWANIREEFLSAHGTGRVIKFVVERAALAQLESLFFVSVDDRHENYWSFVAYCRQSPLNGRGPVRNHVSRLDDGWFDVVAGPIAWDWTQRRHDSYYSQVSFHTKRAADVLNRVLATPNKADVDMVTHKVPPVRAPT
jgi:hypothetical protein